MNRLDYDLGSIIEYRNSGGEILKVKVDEKEDDIKTGIQLGLTVAKNMVYVAYLAETDPHTKEDS